MKITFNRQFFFRLGTIIFLIALGVVMFIIGRGHNLYFDDKTTEINGTSVPALYKVVVDVKGNETQKLYARERVGAKIMGQTFTLNLKVTEVKNGEEKELSYRISVPHSLDGVVINIPLLVAGYDQSDWMTEFVSLATSSTAEDEVVVTDEFSMSEGF